MKKKLQRQDQVQNQMDRGIDDVDLPTLRRWMLKYLQKFFSKEEICNLKTNPTAILNSRMIVKRYEKGKRMRK